MKSVMVHQFSQIPRADIPRSSFNRTHGYKTAFDAGFLVPFYVDEALPGDTFHLRANLFARLSTPIKPIMDNLYLETFYFAVPIRLVWDNWQKFNGEQKNPGDSTDFLCPTLTAPAGGWLVGTIADYFGLPTQVANIKANAFHFRAYNLIWNEWFRSEDLQNSVPVNTGDGPDSNSDYNLLRRGKRHDYFTSALPWPQKGPGVNLPLGTTAPVYGNGKALGLSNSVINFGLNKIKGYDGTTYQDALGVSPTAFGTNVGTAGSMPNTSADAKSIGVVKKGTGIGFGESGLYADLSSATAATINSLRQAFQIQKLQERDARGGTRYTEILRSHFGVVSPDARLQRPEYLGGSSSRIIINPVQQNTPVNAGSTPLGNLGAFGLVHDSSGGFTKSFTEHCVLIGMVNVRADLTYQNGIPKMFSRSTRWDFYWPALAHLGEQAVLNKEIYAQGTATDDEVFGYQERWSEYRYFPSKITGKFRSNYAQTLDVWHLSQKFTSLPTLSSQFIQDDPPISRVVAVTTEPQFIFDSHIELKCARPLPVYSVPGLVDHF